jgi:chemotaxis response regulator CheB
MLGALFMNTYSGSCSGIADTFPEQSYAMCSTPAAGESRSDEDVNRSAGAASTVAAKHMSPLEPADWTPVENGGSSISRPAINSECRDIIVIGASAGGVEALCAVMAGLPADLPAAVFVVMHMTPWHKSALPRILSRCGPLPAVHPDSGAQIEHGRIFVAPPDQHLLIGDHAVELWHGPRENNSRPSINALFRSAAVAYGPRVAGVILTGALEDGTTGLWWIKRMKGVAVVQDPADAQFRQMPETALSHVPADFVAPAAELGKILSDLARGVRRTKERNEELPK